MGLFDSDWQRLHKKVSRDYELIAIRNFEDELSPESADVFGIIAFIVKEQFPNLSDIEAEDFVKNEYQNYRSFSVKNDIANALRKVNPDIPEIGVMEIFETVKSRFINSNNWHEYFLFFIISKIIELKKLSISRGYYLLEISTGKIPKPSRFIRFFQMRRQVKRYNVARDQQKLESDLEDFKITKHKNLPSSTKKIIRIQFGDVIDSEIKKVLTEVIKDEFENEYDLKIETSPDYQELFAISNKGKVDIFIINLTRINFDNVHRIGNYIKQALLHIVNLKIFGWQSVIVLSGYKFDKQEIDIIKDTVDYYFDLPINVEEFIMAFKKCSKKALDFRNSIKQ